MTEMGKKIRLLRLSKGMTQEQLAEKLCVTPQTVSKWENCVTAPDIALLPQISVVFGVTIDELFSITDETKLCRIECLLSCSSDNEKIPEQDFLSYRDFLTSHINDTALKPRMLSALTSLYLQQAAAYRAEATRYALSSLECDPLNKQSYSALREAMNGADRDWHAANHHELIDCCKNFAERYPDSVPAFQLLLDNLIADGRAQDAEQQLQKFSRIDNTCRTLWYKARLHALKGETDYAEQALNEMTERFSADWLAWSYRGDFFACRADYDKAVDCYERAASLHPAPRYTDNYLCIAEIRAIQGRYREASEYYAKAVELLKTDWHTTEGTLIDEYKSLAEKYANA